VPSYAVSYDCLGDQEAFSLKYAWELAVYFGFFVLPMFNGLFADPQFIPGFLKRYGILGSINGNLQRLLSAFFQWKKTRRRSFAEPNFVEFYDMAPLRDAEKLFYQAGLNGPGALAVLDGHLARLKEFARYVIAHVYASVLGNPDALTNGAFVESLDLRNTDFHPQRMAEHYANYAGASEHFSWDLDPFALVGFIQPPAQSPVPQPAEERGPLPGTADAATGVGARSLVS